MIDILVFFSKAKQNIFCSIINISCLCLKVLDTNPLPGMTINPSEGVVPVGGHADLRICFTPIAKMSFDTRVEVFKTGRICLWSFVLCVYLWRCMFI